MMHPKKNLCIFIHFSEQPLIPLYVQMYLRELCRYFDELILTTNERTIDSGLECLDHKVKLLMVKNAGYDFGKFHTAFQALDLSQYHQIACINDSNILFNSLHAVMDWGSREKPDFWGLIDSYEKPWFSSHADAYHIQSHFLVFNEKALQMLSVFFESLDMEQMLTENDQKKLRRWVIDKWEIGLTQFFLKEGIHLGSYFKTSFFTKKHDLKRAVNLTHTHYDLLIEAGYPLIKKKVITGKKRLRDYFLMTNWDKLILEHGNEGWEIEKLIEELNALKAGK